MAANYPRATANKQGTPIVFTVRLAAAKHAEFKAWVSKRAARRGVKLDFWSPTATETVTFQVFGYGYLARNLFKDIGDQLVVKAYTYNDDDDNGTTPEIAATVTSTVDVTLFS